MDTIYLQYCRASAPFYDHPCVGAAEQLFEAHPTNLPAGWQRTTNKDWVYYAPTTTPLRPQGWKVHVSATPDSAEQVLAACAAYCLQMGVAFKALRDRATLVRRSSKYADRAASGKFVTVYPPHEAALETIVRGLDELVGGLPGPYILSDLRWGAGPVFVRYGAFVSRQRLGPGGQVLECIQDPDGELVEDERRPGFHPPAWAPIPQFLQPALAARAARRLDAFPYRVEAALHFSNGGGVYRARRLADGAPILLKEARPHCGLDGAARDAVHRLERERAALCALAGIPGIPTVDAYVQGVEHTFLGREFVHGRPLHDVIEERNPLLNPASSWSRADYAQWATDVVVRVRGLLDRVHEAGWVFGDLHPGNILITPDERLYLIDFESSAADVSGYVQTLGAVGYQAPTGYRGVAVDEYAMGWLRVGILVPFMRAASLTRHGLDRALAYAVATFDPAPEHFAALRAELSLPPSDSTLPGHTVPDADELLRSPGAAAQFSKYATPERADRLFPGDVMGLLRPGGGVTFAHGAAGVLWTQRLLDQPVEPHHLRWLRAAVARSASELPAGFWTGLTGVAYALAGLDDDLALDCLRWAAASRTADPSLDGLGGLGLLALDPSPRLRGLVAAAGLGIDELGARLGAATTDPKLVPPSLAGASGAAILAVRLWRHTGDATYLRLAHDLVSADLDRYHLRPGQLLPKAATPGRGAGLATGVLGVGLALHEVHTATGDEQLGAALRRVNTEVAGAAAVHGGVLNGTSGQIQYLLATRQVGPEQDAVLKRHCSALAWFTEVVDESVLTLGDACLKCSLDYATGLAGVLATLEGSRRGMPTLGVLTADLLDPTCRPE
ncbi:MAG: class III lanthionine synthetase LanKC [Dermatophilaceae bacterium]